MTESNVFASSVPKYEQVYAIVRQIPPGRVATYGQIASLAQMPGQARLVGYALYRVDMDDPHIPWHRVINAKGTISHSIRRMGSDYCQRSRLEAEGIQFQLDGTIDFHTYRWESSGLQ